MKKRIILGCATFLILAAGLVTYLVYYLFYSMGHLPEGELLNQTMSPNRTYTMNLYKVNGGATTDFSIRGELVDNQKNHKENIYWVYRSDQAEASWVDDHTVIINGHKLDVRTDKYDWRREQK